MAASEPINLFLSCARGIEPLLAREAAALGALEPREQNGGVACQGDWASAYRICLWSRLASRVLLPVSQYKAETAEQLYDGAKAVDWPAWFSANRSFAVEVAGHSNVLTHTHFAALKVKDAIADRFRDDHGRRPDVDANAPDVAVHLHLNASRISLSLDLSGGSLHRRGYRAKGAAAPLKETLAAAILLRAGWPEVAGRGGALIDPLCGSGTLVIEAALMAADSAPGLARERYGFQSLRNHDRTVWEALLADARARREAGLKQLPPLLGQDIDGATLRAARRNAELAGLGGHTQWSQADVSTARPVGDAPGLVATNPPYGERLGSEAELIKLYSLLGHALKQHFGGWQAAVFTGRPDLGPRLGLRAEKMYALYNGDLPCKLLLFDIPTPAPVEAAAPGPGGGAEDFTNRLRKNLKHLGKWAKRSGVSCYRVYDADLPDYALAVDLYPTASPQIHAQEYAAPKTVDPIKAEKRLREALAVIQQVFEVPAAAIHFKIRKQQKGSEQYTRQGEQDRFQQVEEHGCRLWVNLDDYLDTGLFLDHRPLRRRLQAEAAGKRFLNLFCYTATATVHAAKGGASGTVSVDLSANYLEWAQRNLELNGYKSTLKARRRPDDSARGRNPWKEQPSRHQLIQADCLAWLEEQARNPAAQRYDLILCDPPTFSNSKRMDGTLDVQRDHVQMLRNAAQLLTPQGVLYFSTNRKRFKLDQEALAGLDISDITAQTLDEDFKRPPPPHRCWAIRRGST
ncbi:MAG TPA: bifunctional 23S rRNA (guanine(2069)-N(7))-methyltransferase RlmK/23S rRNA (guanine(2445)-N(2))-methyltransferase RlmL [Nevskia sp.]|nr:bifunctional 23S rRNA (guanine(2069)-N(7))-methyltransferase RlmK/23S rRNA (guanine(2445)-N(2))-methyltransferase RlmL [Nevskia sp.]